MSFWKYIIGVVAIGVFTTILNSQYQNKKLDVEQIQQEREFTAKFLENALDKDLEKRRDFAEYFSRLSSTEESKKKWDSYKQYVVNQIKEAKMYEKEIATLKEKIIAAKEDGKNINNMQIFTLTKTLEEKKRELSSLRSENFRYEQKYLELRYILQKIKLYGNKKAAKLYFTQKFDSDMSGKIDSLDEVAFITCNDWEMAEAFLPYEEKYKEGLPITVWAEYLGISEMYMYIAMNNEKVCLSSK